MDHEVYMQRALDLARKGWPHVAPNPMVGCVIVADNKIVSEGYHQMYGEVHAEVNAIAALPGSVNPLDCTLYVTLEPCAHFGKTPPCVDLILQTGFKKVVVACTDPNPKVSGTSIKKMQDVGVEVILGVLGKEARELNKIFIGFFEKKRPYYVLKWAQTADGFLTKGIPTSLGADKISGPEADQMVHQMRAEVMGIMVGKNTVLRDNPYLTTRLVTGKNPRRIFLDQQLEVPSNFNVFNQEADTIVFNGIRDDQVLNVRFIKIEFEKNVLAQVSEKLYELSIQSVLVEGGAFLLDDFIKQGFWDELLVFENPNLNFSSGLKAPAVALGNIIAKTGKDNYYHLTNKVDEHNNKGG
jgi:diaminohydroxyphosphoribosylaminopyrimidine deaminase/5-amino-6-(5-phosphoribosylamino)uracil reductase